MKKKLFAVILAGTMLFCLLPTSFTPVAMAEDVTLISDRAGLEDIKNDTSGHYRLTADIDLSGKDWTPLPEFSGTLDGGDHMIRNLSITDTTADTGNSKGLFASIADSGNVANLGLEGVNITARDSAGGIAGTNSGTISRCYTTGTVSGAQYAGGLVGQNDGAIENCYSRVSVSGTSDLGGLAGSNAGTIEKCYAASTVTDSVMKNYLQFAGGYVDIPNAVKKEYEVNSFTLEAWFQWDALSVDTDKVEFIVSKEYEHFEIHTGGGSGENGIRFIPIPQGGTPTTPDGINGDSYIDVHNVLQEGWFHVAAVYSYDNSKTTDNITVRVYVNGEAQDLYQSASAEPVGTTAKLTRTSNPLVEQASNTHINIGRRCSSASYYFNGKIADVRLWETARTEAQIKANKDKVLDGDEAGLIGYWKLDESSGLAVDSSATQNHGTVSDSGVTRVTSSVSAANKGALTGSASGSGSVSNCFYDSTLYDGSDSSVSGPAKSTGDMQIQSTYTNWNFDTIWKMNGSGYPNLGFKTVTSVAVSPATADVAKGGTKQFSATVTGTNGPAQTVSWSVAGGKSGTTIDKDGNLLVAADETAAMLTVKAVSTADTDKFNTATVTVVTAPIDPVITKGQHGQWTGNSTDGLGFTSNGLFDTFTGVLVDGDELSIDQYTAQSGSTIVTLKASYLKTLSVGRHTLRINFLDGYAETDFTILAEADVPTTGDDAQPMLWLGLMLIAGALLTTTAVLRRRRQNG